MADKHIHVPKSSPRATTSLFSTHLNLMDCSFHGLCTAERYADERIEQFDLDMLRCI